MRFTNPEDFAETAQRLSLAGWYVQDSSGDFLGILRKDSGEWFVGFTPLDDVAYPVDIDRIPK